MSIAANLHFKLKSLIKCEEFLKPSSHCECFYYNPYTFVDIQVIAVVCVRFEQASSQDDSHLPISLCVKLQQCLEEQLYYDEVLVAFSRLQTECRDFIGLMQSCGAMLHAFDYMPE